MTRPFPTLVNICHDEKEKEEKEVNQPSKALDLKTNNFTFWSDSCRDNFLVDPPQPQQMIFINFLYLDEDCHGIYKTGFERRKTVKTKSSSRMLDKTSEMSAGMDG